MALHTFGLESKKYLIKSMDKIKKIIKYILISLLFTCLIEGIILCFTDNKMYCMPLNSQSAKNIREIDNLQWDNKQKNFEEFSLSPQKNNIKTICFKFKIGSYVDSIMCFDNTSTEPIIELNNVDSSTCALLILPDSSRDYHIIIKGTFTISDYFISSDKPIIKKQKIPNPFRCVLLFFCIIYICIKHKTILNLLILIRKINYRKCIKDLFMFSGLTGIWMMIYIFIISLLNMYNIYQFRFALFSGLSISVIIFYVIKKIKNLETFWLLLSMIFILCCVLVYPVFAYGGDSAIHLQRSIDVAQAYDENIYRNYVDAIQSDGNVSYEIISENIESANEAPIHSFYNFKYRIFKNTRYIAYIPYASGLVIADAFNMNAYHAFLLSEIVNGWFCAFLYYIAARKLKSGKLILCLFASLPYIFIMMSRYSYTSWVIAGITLACAQIIALLQTDKIIKIKDLVPIYGTFVAGILPKAPYMLMSFLGILLPKNRFANKDYRKNILLIFITNFILLMSLIVPIFTNSKGIGLYSDTRGGENVDAVAQLFFILKNPIIFIKILIRNMINLLSPGTFIVGSNGVSSFGSTIGPNHWVVFPWLIVGIFLFVILTDMTQNKETVLIIKNRICGIIITMISMMLICTVMYMNYSNVGADYINGVNPLYLLTTMFPIFYFSRFKLNKNHFSYRKYNSVILLLWMALLYVSLYKEVIMRYLFS